MIIVTVAYLSLNAAYLHVLPLDTVLNSQHVAADAAAVLAGSRGATLVAILVLISAFGGLSGTVLAGPRVYYAIANDGLAWKAMATAHARFQTPHVAIIAQAIWVSVLVATGTYRALFTRVVYTEFLFFGLMTIGLMRVEKRVTIAPLIFLLGCALVVGNQLAADWKESAIGLLLVCAGIPVYYFLSKGLMIIDFHNHYYPPRYLKALQSGESAVKVTFNDQGHACIHYPGDYNIAVPGQIDLNIRRKMLDDQGIDMQVYTLDDAGHACRDAGDRSQVSIDGE